MGVVDQSWVTVALNDVDAEKAVVLAKSLRNSATTRRLSVIFSKNVSEKMKDVLLRVFDQCLRLEHSHELNGISEELYAKILLWNIPFLKKCIFLHPDVLVLKNSDELFGFSGISAPLDPTNELDTGLMIVEPDFTTHEKLMEWMKAGKHGANPDLLQRYSKWIQSHANFSALPEKYFVSLTPGKKPVALTETAVSILRFLNGHPLDLKSGRQVNNGANEGIFERAVYAFYDKLYQDSFSGLMEKSEPLPTVPRALLDNGQEPIAVVGMSCRFPMADNIDEYWDILVNGKDCIRKVPEHRWPSATDDDYRGIQAGFLKCPVDEFDGKFFNISPFELTHMDPQQRLLLEVTWEALEDAGINPQILRGTQTAVYLGTWLQDYRELIRNAQGEFTDFHRTYLGNSLGGSGGRLSFFLGLTGSNIATESGCSSSMAALSLAVDSLRKRRSDIALAAGANLILYPFQKKHMISVVSPDGRCKTFDESADGFGRAEGVATLVLKRYSDALKEGDNVLALIRGCGLSQEGTSRSLGTPTKEVQEIAMRVALEDAGISPTDVSFVEAHGTGTPVGDPIELAAISSIYCKDAERAQPLYVASGKTMIGHTESCSGLAGIIKVILSMKNKTIPPHLHLKNLNPYIRIDDLPLEIPTTAVKWESIPGKPRFAGVSSFGITGTDSHVIIQEPPTYNPPALSLEIEERPLHLFTFSGKSESALNDVVTSFASFLESNPDIGLADAAHTLNDGRAHFMHRVGVVASSSQDLLKKMKNAVKGSKLMPEVQPKICFLFTGQGSQYVGMAKTLYETNAVFKMNFDVCDQLLQDNFQISIKPVIWGQVESEALHRTLYSQTCIFCVEYCLLKMWESWGIKPDAVMGHSLGEFAATVAAGLVKFEDALKLVAVRSRLVETMCKEGKMVVIKADEKTVDGFRKEFLANNRNSWLDFAAVNSSDQTVLAGPPPVVDAFAMYCTEKNLKTHVLDATNAFHSRDMDDIIQEYEKVTKSISPNAAGTCTYFSGLKGVACQASEINSDYWTQHSRDRVRFIDACKAAYEDGCRVFLEVGPQPVLCALAMKNISGESEYEEPITVMPSIRRKENEWATLLETLTKLYQMGFHVDWKGFDQFHNRRKIKLPTYPFNRKKHWFESKENKQQGVTLNGKSLHPLLGCQIPNATTTSIFQGTIELDKLPYLKDHAIGGQAVFPAAGFLEVALKSGNLSTIGEIDENEDLMNPISIEKLMIEAPLGLYENEPCQMQTVVMKMDSAENKVSIYTAQRRSGTNDEGMDSVKWIRQASGTFVPLQASVVQQNNESVLDALDDIRERCNVEIDTNRFYENLTGIGLEFGTTFRSVGKLYRNENDKNEILTEILYPNCSSTADTKSSANSNNKHYVCHPVVLDALIQTIMLGQDEDEVKKALIVPVLIDKMIVLSKIDVPSTITDSSSLPVLYAHSKWDVNQIVETRSVTLYAGNGKVLGIMSGVQMIQTSSEVILKTLSNQQLVVPDMFEEIWASKSGPFKNRANLLPLQSILQDDSVPEMGDLNLLTDRERRTVDRRNELIYNFILQAFYQLGWKPTEMFSAGDSTTVERFMDKLGVVKSYNMLTNRLLQILVEEGIMQACQGEEQTLYKLIKLPPSAEEVEMTVEKLMRESDQEETIDYQVVQACGEKLSNILAGKISALSVLFPEEKGSAVSAENYYNNCFMAPKFNAGIHHIFQQLVQQHASLPEEERGIIRILEVGAGTGSSTKTILPIFEKFGTRFQYTYTDISPVFFNKAGELFQGYGKRIQYKVLNIENDPLEQGFVPQQYDIVFASNVLHATKSLAESVRNARILMKDNGYLILAETMKEIRDYDILFGLLDSYWRFTDFESRKSYPCVGPALWKKVCASEGFDEFKNLRIFDDRLGVVVGKATKNYNFNTIAQAYNSGKEEKSKWWLVFSSEERYRKYFEQRMSKFGRKVLLVSAASAANPTSFVKVSKNHIEVRAEVKEDFLAVFNMIKERNLSIEGILYLWGLEPETEILKRTHGFLFLSQILLSDFKGLPRLIVPTEGIMRLDDESATDVSPATLCGMAKTLRTEHYNLHVKCIDLDPDEMDENVKYDELLTELWNDDQEFQITYRQRNRHVARLVTCKDFASPLPLPKCERFSLLLPKVTKNIADLKFCPNGKSVLKENEIEIKVRAYGLNFRDIFTVLKPNEEFEKWNTMGLEFSGTVVSVGEKVGRWKVGDYVIGCNFAGGALPSHLCMEEDMVFGMPEQVTFCEAATIPAAFATVYYCLVMIADLKKGENVLIHAGSGGVGLFAIQVAKALGANIFTTAGCRRKRTFLKNLGVTHVFHSRNTDYGKQIPEVLKGQGIHVVLNSLTSPGFKEASLGCCAKGARFVEMSRLHIWTPEEVQALRPDVQYTAVDLTKVGKDVWQAVWGAVKEYMDRKLLNPIPFIQYDATCVREALFYMQKAKHIGKIIITMPEMVQKENEIIPKNSLFSDRATYLITGGLGGIGGELAKWMCQLGAKHLVLTSRNKPDERASKIITELNSKGCNLVPLCVDIGDFEQCEKLLQDISDPKLNLPRLRGIFHLAGCLQDATLTNQTLKMYKEVFQGKVHGAINLHRLTKDYNLEFFNLFSSMVSCFGPIGQSNYAAANTFLDALAGHRHSIGLCGQSVNWGQWGEVGLSKDIKVPAMRPFSPLAGLSGLEIIMRSQKTQVCVFDVDFTVVRKLTANIGAYLEELKIAKETQSVAFDVKINNFWEDFNACDSDEGRVGVIKSYVCQILKQILKLDDDEVIDVNQKFSEMGMDSLMMLEMKNFLQTMLGKSISINVSEMAELTTINKLANHLMTLIQAANGGNEEQDVDEEQKNSYNYYSPSQRKMIEEDMILPEHIKAQADNIGPCKPSEIKTVLLTGATGNLGPYVMDSLIQQFKHVEKVYCLVRANDVKAADERLLRALQQKNLGGLSRSRLEPIVGDVTDAKLGMDEATYNLLAEAVDAVVHCAVQTNVKDPYMKPQCNLIRNVNVIGTSNVLSFAGKIKTKRVLHVSTIVACQKITEDDTLFENFCEPADVFDVCNRAFSVSKSIAEQLCKQANDRGMPVQVIRLPILLGDHKGTFAFPENHAMLRLLGFCRLAAMPLIPIPMQVLPVDFAAQKSLQIFFSDSASTGVYNLTNPKMNILQDFPQVAAEFNLTVNVVENDEFFKKLSENDDLSLLFPYRDLEVGDGRLIDFNLSPTAMQCWNRNPDKFFVSNKVSTVIPDYEESVLYPVDIIRRDMSFAKASGIFSQMKLNY